MTGASDIVEKHPDVEMVHDVPNHNVAKANVWLKERAQFSKNVFEKGCVANINLETSIVNGDVFKDEVFAIPDFRLYSCIAVAIVALLGLIIDVP